jgi:hypothetical protein
MSDGPLKRFSFPPGVRLARVMVSTMLELAETAQGDLQRAAQFNAPLGISDAPFG